mmetsp:Transcript_17601/g.33398  ORF Transcript_17601/g.33398 Transcript_17601/m.33398 type:complete len:90 (-) Transcript_17601:149-418(-)
MCQVTTIRAINNTANAVVLSKPVLANIQEDRTAAEEYGSYGDYWGFDELSIPAKRKTLEPSPSTASLKSVDSTASTASYGSFWGLDQEE